MRNVSSLLAGMMIGALAATGAVAAPKTSKTQSLPASDSLSLERLNTSPRIQFDRPKISWIRSTTPALSFFSG